MTKANTHSQTVVSQQVNRQQVKELLRVFRKNEWRGSMNPFTQKRGGAISGMIGMLGMNVFFSLLLTALLLISPDIQGGLIITGGFVMFFISFQIMLEFGKTIIAPEDYYVVAPLPVSSRTFYAAKQIYFLTHVTIITLTLSLAPLIGAVIHTGSALIGLETLLVFWLCGIFSSQIVAVVYTLMLRFMNPAKMERYLGYAQMTLSMSFSLMYLWITNLKPIIKSLDVNKFPLVTLIPSYWFTAPFRIITEGWRSGFALGTLAGVVAFVLLYYFSSRTLSLKYAESLLKSSQSSATVKPQQRLTFVTRLWRRYLPAESRAVLTLLRAQFRGDARFRIRLLVTIPLLLLPLLNIFKGDAGLADPFVTSGSYADGSNTLLVMLMIFPMMVTMSVYHSSAFKAAWIFFATPVKRVKLLTGARTVASVMLMAPIGAGLSVIFSYFYGNAVHAVLHTLFIILLIRILVVIAVFFNPGVPFSLPMAGNAGFSLRRLLAVFLPGIGVLPLLAIQRFGYGGYFGYILILGAAFLLGWALEKVSDEYLVRRFGSWEFVS